MAAIVFLSPTEADLVRLGRLAEPSFRPHPRSAEYYYQSSDGFGLEDEHDAGNLARLGSVQSLQHNAMAHHWKRHSYYRALLLAPSRVLGDTDVIGVSVAAGSARISGLNGVRRLLVGPWSLFAEAVRISEVASELSGRAAADMARILRDGHSRPLPDALSAEFDQVLRRRVRNYSHVLASLPTRRTSIIRRIERPAVTDANLTALRLFSRSWRDLEPVPASAPTEFSVSIELAARGSEDDYITDDSTLFLDWDRSHMSQMGWWEFRKGNRRLHVKNINVSTAENSTGADLVYASREPDTVVLVQYKLLEVLRRSDEPVFRPDGRLSGQIDRMLQFSPNSPERGPQEEHARIGGDFGFIKFILPAESDASIVESPVGRYFPADAVRRMLVNPEAGPNGGVLHYVHQRRYIDAETFAKLVRDRWIGSTGSATKLLLGTLGVRPSEERQAVTLAVEERL